MLSIKKLLTKITENIISLNNKLAPSTKASLLTGEVAVSGGSSWNTPVKSSINLSNYNWLYVQAGVSSAAYQTQMIYLPAMIESGDSSYTSVYWNDGNRVGVQISATGSVTVSTKTQNYGGIYKIYGIK